MQISRRRLIESLAVGAASLVSCVRRRSSRLGESSRCASLLDDTGTIDWQTVRALFPLAPDWTHLASFLLVSHPRPVAEAIEVFRRKLDADPG
jgi:hypothetical protein